MALLGGYEGNNTLDPPCQVAINRLQFLWRNLGHAPRFNLHHAMAIDAAAM
jgi:hypothetical protein